MEPFKFLISEAINLATQIRSSEILPLQTHTHTGLRCMIRPIQMGLNGLFVVDSLNGTGPFDRKKQLFSWTNKMTKVNCACEAS